MAIKYVKRSYKRRNCIEIMFGRLKNGRRIATSYGRCSVAFRAAINLAAAVIFRLGKERGLSRDALTRMHARVLDLWRKHKPAMLLVTHDILKAEALADRILVLD